MRNENDNPVQQTHSKETAHAFMGFLFFYFNYKQQKSQPTQYFLYYFLRIVN